MAGVTYRPSGFRGAVLALGLAIAMAPSPARAQADGETDAEERAQAKALLDKGDQHLRRGNAMRERGHTDRAIDQYEQALDAYESAFDAFPESRIYFPIARAEEQLGRYLDAHRHYQLVLEDVEELGDRLRAEVEHRQERVRARLAAVHVLVQPDGAEVAIDGESVGRAPFDEAIHVAAGEHTVEISADAHASRRLEVDAAEGGDVQLVVALEPTPDLSADSEAGPGDAAQSPAPPPAPSRAPLAAGISVTAGLGVAATVTGLMAVSKHGTFTDTARPPDERRSARDSGQIFALATDVLLVATAAAAGYTAYYYYGIYRGDDAAGGEARADAQAGADSIWVAPYAAESGGGLALGGRF